MYSIIVQQPNSEFQIWLCDEKKCDVVTFDEDIPTFTLDEVRTICHGVWKLKKVIPLK